MSNYLSPRLQTQRLKILIALVLFVVLGVIILSSYGWKYSILFVIGVAYYSWMGLDYFCISRN